jgi:hypothetical protein
LHPNLHPKQLIQMTPTNTCADWPISFSSRFLPTPLLVTHSQYVVPQSPPTRIPENDEKKPFPVYTIPPTCVPRCNTAPPLPLARPTSPVSRGSMGILRASRSTRESATAAPVHGRVLEYVCITYMHGWTVI